jgi:U4/U6 small nuclear ribonucleoprotein PRP4
LANQDASTDNDAEIHVITQIDNSCENMYKSLRKVTLEGSQYGDARALSAITTFVSPHDSTPLVATASWSATIKLWDASELRSVGTTELAHEDRIMGIAIQNIQQDTICATASIDMTAKLWKVERSQDVMMDTGDDEDIMPYTISELAVLKGHAARLCKTAFHPMGQHVATTSFDHTWRLWDVPTKTEVLLQDGHARPVYGLGFHPDGSLLATTDFCGVVHNWDLRTGKTIWHMEKGHAKRVLCVQYNPNGFQLATAGDDGTIKVWDLRKRQVSSSIPAHSNLITQVEVAEEYIASSSFDGTAKLWSTRDYKLLTTLRGHEGKVTGVGLVPGDGHRIVTSGYDKTIKLWK